MYFFEKSADFFEKKYETKSVKNVMTEIIPHAGVEIAQTSNFRVFPKFNLFLMIFRKKDIFEIILLIENHAVDFLSEIF